MVRAINLIKKYGEFTAVCGVTLQIKPGEIYGFLGPNGSGKTTVMLMLLGILKPTSGEVYLFGERMFPGRVDLRSRVGMVPERHPNGIWNWMTAQEYLEFFAELFKVKAPQNRIKMLLEKVGLEGVRNKRIKEFSRGMLQKLSVIRALLNEPEILFLDEPISGLDPVGISQVRDLILSENRKGRSMFISSHLLSEMEKICNRVAIISEGALLAEESMYSLISKLSRYREIYLELETLPDNLVKQLRKLDFVLECTKVGNSMVLKVPVDRDYRRDISRFLLKKNLVPLRIDQKSISLEEAFIRITRENVALLVGSSGEKKL